MPARWGEKLQPFEVGQNQENKLVSVNYGKKSHSRWGHNFQFFKRMAVEKKNPFATGPNAYCSHERLQHPAGVPEVPLTVDGEVDLRAARPPPPPDPARPWMPEGFPSARAGRGDGSVIERPAAAAPERSLYWTDASEMKASTAHTDYQTRVQLTKKAHQLQKRARPRPQSAARQVWDNWESNVDKARTQDRVAAMCNRGRTPDPSPKSITLRSKLAARITNNREDSEIADEAKEKAEELMRTEALKHVTRDGKRPVSAKHVNGYRSRVTQRASSVQARSRPMSAVSSTKSSNTRRPGTAVARQSISDLQLGLGDVRTLDIPLGWRCAGSVSYGLTEQLNANTKEPVVP